MQKKHIVFLVLFSLLILFYPGENKFINIFFFNRDLFNAKKTFFDFQYNPIPFVKDKNIIPITSANGIYIVDLKNLTPIYKKNENVKFFPASTTKIITALVAIEKFNLDDVLEVKRDFTEGQLMGLFKGEKITLENLLYGILVHSGNDAAYTIADNYSGGFDGFIGEMNKKAKELKMQNSHFKNPAGLDDFDQHSTPFDLTLAGRELLKNKLLAKIVSTRSITVSDVDFKYFHYLQNVNKLLGEIPGLGGLKTGYTEEAGENLISFYKKNNNQFIIVVLNSKDRFFDTKNLIDWINLNVDFIK